MIPPDWVGVVEHFIAPVSVIVSFALGRAVKSAVNQRVLDDLSERVARNERRGDDHDKLLAQHVTLHQGYVQVQSQLLSVDRKLNAVCGKLGIDGTQ